MLAALDCDAGFVDCELERVEGDFFHGFSDLESDIDVALIAPRLAGLDVEDGEGVVRRLYAVKLLASVPVFNSLMYVLR